MSGTRNPKTRGKQVEENAVTDRNSGKKLSLV